MDWTEQTLPTGHWLCQRFGPLTILLANHQDEWRLKSWLDDSAPVSPGRGVVSELPHDLDWFRWDNDPKDERCLFRPLFPDLPFIARPHSPLWIAPKGKAQFYLGVPLIVEVRASFTGELRPMTTLSSQALSKTWHGDRSKGNPCYTLRTSARRKLRPEDWHQHDIVCAVEIVNQSDQDFHFQQIYLETGHLGIHLHEDLLWSNSCRVRVLDNEDAHHQIIFTRNPPEPANDAPSISEPKEGHLRKASFRNTFSSFIDVLGD